MELTLSAEDVGLMGSSVREISSAVERLAQVAITSPLKAESAATKHHASEFNLTTVERSTVVNDVYGAILFATVAGADHVRAYVSLLPKSRATVALATLTRGAIEAFAKANYLLLPAESQDFIGRFIDMTEHELRFPLKYSLFQDHTGAPIDKEVYPSRLREIKATLTPIPAAADKTTEQVRLLLQSALDDDNEVGLDLHNIYSQLSGAAHAGTSALGMYAGAGRDPLGFVYPRQVALEHVAYIFAATTALADSVVDHFEMTGAELDRWNGALGRASVALTRLRNSA